MRIRTEADPEQPEEKAENPASEKMVMPQVTFATFILSLASSALVQLGEVANPETGEKQEDLVMAKHTIDILSMLQEKTKDGLDADEHRLLEGILYDLRMKYVFKKK